MGLIPEEVIDEIRARADIVAVIGQHVQLRKAGRNHKGVCPFHGDKDPSFNVNPDKQFFYCFGCHKKGDVFTFLMEYEGKSFVEAAEALAAIAGVEIPAIPQAGQASGRRRTERTEMLRANREAADFFRSQLGSDAGTSARDYLAERGVATEVAEAFRLGCAPAEWGALSDHLKKAGISLEMAEKIGLIARRPRSPGYYDRFRDRLMCPVMTTAGDVVGFSGRRLSDGSDAEPNREPPPKYINSPESTLYKKSKLLYGLYQARDGFRQKKRAIVVEGNFDVVAMHQAGFTETVAPLGTALTEEQAELLRRLAGRTVLLYDGDRAGRAATLRALQTLLAADVEVLIAVVPDGNDPDTLLREHGTEAVQALIDAGKPGVEFFIQEVWTGSSQSADDRERALREAAPVIRSIANPTKRDLVIGTFATALGISEELTRRALRRALTSASRSDTQTNRARRATNDTQSDRARDVGHSAPPPHRELLAIGLLADHPALISRAEELNLFSYLTDHRLRDMYCAAQKGGSLLAALPDDPAIASQVLSGAYKDVSDPAQTLADIVTNLAKAQTLTRLATRRSLDPEEERRRTLEIWTTRRQAENDGKNRNDHEA